MSTLPTVSSRQVRSLRGLLLCLTIVLSGVGLLMVYSASVTSRPTENEQVYLLRHAAFLGVASILAIACSRIPPRVWFHIAPVLFWGTIGLLILVLVPGIGTRVNGAQRWIRYGMISLQPSELAKVTLVVHLCRLIERHRTELGQLGKGTIPFVIPLAIMLPLVLKQPDLGTALFLLVGAATVLFLGGWPVSRFILLGAIGLPAVWFLFALEPYQAKRIAGFLAGWQDVDAAPYQIRQSLLSLGSGGLWGIGLGRGWQKLSFLPEANTDFVFSVIGEELGLVGTAGIVLLWIAFFWIGRKLVGWLPRGSFERILGLTLLIQLVAQAALNIAIVTSLVPPKGIPHPLLSYGGNSLVISLVSIGIIMGLTRELAHAEETVSRSRTPRAGLPEQLGMETAVVVQG